ncbi:MAG TPA: TasA family protein [Nonomuraea sp.]|nr:TasA family protein [Nonomuraea sp.]
MHLETRPRSRRRDLALLVLLAGLLVSGAGMSALSLALFSDQETVPGTFGSGSIVLDAAKVDALSLTTADMLPGDSVTDDVIVENDGTAQLRYALSTSSSDPDAKALRDVLTLTVKTIDLTTPSTPCDDFDGVSTLYGGALGASTAGFGSPTAGSQAGDRTLAAAASETLCFRISLPSTAGNAYQSATTTTTFTFDAEQTANNP